MRGRISGVRSYARPTEIGEVIEGRVVGQVVRSRDPAFRDGEYASGGYGWQLYSAVPASGLLKLDPAEAPISTALGILGMPGMTAYLGLADIGQPKAGETVVVAAASGAVGAVAGQLAKRQGARVVGIAGGAEKCRYVTDELGFDAAVDHQGDLGAALDRACPNGIDVYFENAGGAVQQAVFPRLNDFARMVMCGMIAEYNDREPRPGPISPPSFASASRSRASSSATSASATPSSARWRRPWCGPASSNTGKTSSPGWSARPKRSSACCRARISASSW
jgi:NADPH-dependent curcumin reductase